MNPAESSVPDTLAGRNRVLMERNKALGDAVYSEPMGLVIRPNVGADYTERWGFDVVQSSAWYAVSLARWCADRPGDCAEERRRLNRILLRMCEKQDRDPASATYGNIVWTWGWDAVKDRNGVSFWSPEAGYIFACHRDLLAPETERVLADTLSLCVEGLDRHRVRWQYTNIFLLNILSRLTLAKALSREAVLARACEDWKVWFSETDQGGLTEYNSPTYIVTALAPLGRMLDWAPEERMRRQIETALESLYADFCWHYHPELHLLAGPMSRAYSGDWLGSSLTNIVAYQQFKAPLKAVNLVGPFVALSHYQAPEACTRRATQDKAGVTVRASIPDNRIRRMTSFGSRYALGVKSGPAYGQQELAFTLAHPGARQPLLFLRHQPGTAAPVYAELRDNALLAGIVFRNPPERGGSPHNWTRLNLGPPDAFDRIAIDGTPWDGTYAAVADGTHLRLVAPALAVDFRFGVFPLNGADGPARCVAYLWYQYEHDLAMLEIVAWGPVLAAFSVAVAETGASPAPARICRTGPALTAELPSGPVSVAVPEDDRVPLPADLPLLDAPGIVWRRGDWAKR